MSSAASKVWAGTDSRQPTPGRGRSRRAAWPWRPTCGQRVVVGCGGYVYGGLRLTGFIVEPPAGAGPERPPRMEWRLSLPSSCPTSTAWITAVRSWSRRSRRRSFLSAAPRRQSTTAGRASMLPTTRRPPPSQQWSPPSCRRSAELFGRRCGDVEFTVIGQRSSAFTRTLLSPTMRQPSPIPASRCTGAVARQRPSSSPQRSVPPATSGSVPPTGTGCGGPAVSEIPTFRCFPIAARIRGAGRNSPSGRFRPRGSRRRVESKSAGGVNVDDRPPAQPCAYRRPR